MSAVFYLWQKSVNEEDDWISGGKDGCSNCNERRPTVAIDDMPEHAAGGMRMNADEWRPQRNIWVLGMPCMYSSANRGLGYCNKQLIAQQPVSANYQIRKTRMCFMDPR